MGVGRLKTDGLDAIEDCLFAGDSWCCVSVVSSIAPSDIILTASIAKPLFNADDWKSSVIAVLQKSQALEGERIAVWISGVPARPKVIKSS